MGSQMVTTIESMLMGMPTKMGYNESGICIVDDDFGNNSRDTIIP